MRPGSVLRFAVLGRSVGTDRPRRILDVGGYDGTLLASFRAPLARAIVVDIDAAGLSLAQRGGLLPTCASGAALPFPDGAFDAVLLMDVLNALSPSLQDDVVREAARVLCRDGRLYLSNVDPTFRLPFCDMAQLWKLWRARPGESWVRLAQLLDAAGLDVVSQRSFYGYLARLTYACFFHHNLPSRGHRLKLAAWRRVAGFDARWPMGAQARLLVAQRRTD